MKCTAPVELEDCVLGQYVGDPEGKDEDVKALLASGADITAKTSQGNHCLCICAKRTRGDKMGKIILEHAKSTLSLEKMRAYINEPNNNGDIPIMTAVFKENVELVELFRDHGGDILSVNEKGEKVTYRP